MDAELKQKWVKALRSGKYQQVHRALKLGDAYCCIGVGALVANPKFKFEDSFTNLAAGSIGITTEQQKELVVLNDLNGASFPEIADYIEKNL